MTSQPAERIEGQPLIRPSTIDHPLYEDVVNACRTVFDPEIPVNIFDLGLIYTIAITDENEVDIVMSLTAPSPARCRDGSPMRSNRCPGSNK